MSPQSVYIEAKNLNMMEDWTSVDFIFGMSFKAYCLICFFSGSFNIYFFQVYNLLPFFLFSPSNFHL